MHRHRRIDTGRLGEALAARAIEADGWLVLAKRWRDGPRELDLVASRDGMLAFIEVKTRRSLDWGAPVEAVTSAKRREVERAAAAWLHVEGPLHGGPFRGIRFDVIGVTLEPGKRPAVHRFEDAWSRGR